MEIVSVDQIPKLDEIKDVSLDEIAEIYKICNKMQKVCDDHHGLGISAVQVGLPLKLFLVKADGNSKFDSKDQYGYFLNCSYKPQEGSEEIMSIEGCLSIKDENDQLRHFQVKRYTDILVSGHKLNENMELEEFTDFPIGVLEQSVVFQHEIDHHSSILISDIGKEMFLWR